MWLIFCSLLLNARDGADRLPTTGSQHGETGNEGQGNEGQGQSQVNGGSCYEKSNWFLFLIGNVFFSYYFWVSFLQQI